MWRQAPRLVRHNGSTPWYVRPKPAAVAQSTLVELPADAPALLAPLVDQLGSLGLTDIAVHSTEHHLGAAELGDYMVVTSARSLRHVAKALTGLLQYVKALGGSLEALGLTLKAHLRRLAKRSAKKLRKVHSDNDYGVEQNSWGMLSTDDGIVVNILTEQRRAVVQPDQLWEGLDEEEVVVARYDDNVLSGIRRMHTTTHSPDSRMADLLSRARLAPKESVASLQTEWAAVFQPTSVRSCHLNTQFAYLLHTLDPEAAPLDTVAAALTLQQASGFCVDQHDVEFFVRVVAEERFDTDPTANTIHRFAAVSQLLATVYDSQGLAPPWHDSALAAAVVECCITGNEVAMPPLEQFVAHLDSGSSFPVGPEFVGAVVRAYSLAGAWDRVFAVWGRMARELHVDGDSVVDPRPWRRLFEEVAASQDYRAAQMCVREVFPEARLLQLEELRPLMAKIETMSGYV